MASDTFWGVSCCGVTGCGWWRGDMFVRMSSRRNKDGTVVSYLQLVHNDWDPAAKSAKMRVLYNFGRTDQVDRAAIERLIDSLTRVVNPGSGTGAGADAGLSFMCSRPLGGAWVLDHLWSTLGIRTTLTRLVGGTRRDAATERVVFALVANRALAPSSKLAAATWVGADVHIPGLPEVSDDACYRAMDWLLAVEPELGRAVYDQVADLLNLEVDLLFFDTTSTYFETENADAPVWRESTGQRVDTDAHTLAADDPPPGAVGRAGFRTWGKSKDHRDDLPQIVVGMAVTREGIPVRVWSWPGNTADSALIRQVKADLREWNLGRVIWVTDRGFTSQENRRALTRGGCRYTQSWARSCAPGPRRSPPSSPGRAATSTSRRTCRSRRSTSGTGTGSSSRTTPRPRPGTPRCAPTSWPGWRA